MLFSSIKFAESRLLSLFFIMSLISLIGAVTPTFATTAILIAQDKACDNLNDDYKLETMETTASRPLVLWPRSLPDAKVFWQEDGRDLKIVVNKHNLVEVCTLKIELKNMAAAKIIKLGASEIIQSKVVSRHLRVERRRCTFLERKYPTTFAMDDTVELPNGELVEGGPFVGCEQYVKNSSIGFRVVSGQQVRRFVFIVNSLFELKD